MRKKKLTKASINEFAKGMSVLNETEGEFYGTIWSGWDRNEY